MTDWFTGDVAVVTGGASGNGRAISLALAEHGANVVVADLQEDPREGGKPTHELIDNEHGPQATFVNGESLVVDAGATNTHGFESPVSQ